MGIPRGTRLWKEFSFGRPLETRFMVRCADGSWQYATYVWNAAGSDAQRAPTQGITALQSTRVPGGVYTIPAEADCRVCHEGGSTPVLGSRCCSSLPTAILWQYTLISTRQMPLTCRACRQGASFATLLVNSSMNPPRIEAQTPTARAALGYLHANCGHCHNDSGPLAALDFHLAQDLSHGYLSTRVLDTTFGRPAEIQLRGAIDRQLRIPPHRDQPSALLLRMQSRIPAVQMPPLGTRLTDTEGLRSRATLDPRRPTDTEESTP